MQRDPELIRQLMLKLESLDKPATAIVTLSPTVDLAIPDYSGDAIHYHLDQILQCGWVDMAGGLGMNLSGQLNFAGLTPKGHDFIDSVRDDAIWALAKKGATAAGGFTLDTLAALGKGFIRKQISKLTDIDLG